MYFRKKTKKENSSGNIAISKSVAQKPSELRQDLVSGDWVVIATGRAKRPDFFKKQKRKKFIVPKNKCPFEDLQKSGNADPLLVYRRPDKKDWFVQVIPNKYPAFFYGQCPVPETIGPYNRLEGIGFHEVFVTRDHNRQIAQFNENEVDMVLRAYQERYRAIKNDPCAKYILIFHNHGAEAGASVSHPHSQLVALPVVPPDLANSLNGSARFWRKNKKCVHCQMLQWELKHKERIVAQNGRFVALCPFASRRSFEVRIFPKKHSPYFEEISAKDRKLFAQILSKTLRSLYIGLNDPAYNFFIHTSPTQSRTPHYHWHWEILPLTSVWGGVEFGTGIEVSTIPPEASAKYLGGLI